MADVREAVRRCGAAGARGAWVPRNRGDTLTGLAWKWRPARTR
jgi:hypothetical protein